jgi:arginyl-tRNA synthetase
LLGKSIVAEGLEQGVFYSREDGSVWADLTQDGLDEKLVLRSDGTSVYITQDLGTAELRFKEFTPGSMCYVVGNEQDYHFKVLLLLLKKLGRNWAANVHHISYGMVDLPSGKMKSREGTVVDADDLISEMEQMAAQKTAELGKADNLPSDERLALHSALALGALKYYLLRVEPKKRMLFNPEESIEFQGDTGVFIQYGHARACSILRKAAERGFTPAVDIYGSSALQLDPIIAQLLASVLTLPEVVQDAARQYAPSLVAAHSYQIARDLGRFLYEVPVLQADSEQERNFRLAVVALSRDALAFGLQLLGITPPARM